MHAGKLLREGSRGADSPWAPYLAVLPAEVATPVSWPWDLISRVVYPPAAAHLYDTSWVVESAVSQTLQAAVCTGGALEPLSEMQAESLRCVLLILKASVIWHGSTIGTCMVPRLRACSRSNRIIKQSACPEEYDVWGCSPCTVARDANVE